MATLVGAATCTSAPLNSNLVPDELRVLIREMGLQSILVDQNTPEELVQMARKSGASIVTARANGSCAGLFELTGDQERTPSDRSYPHPDDIFVLLQTSGTTATPKIVPQSQLNRLTVALRLAGALRIGPHDSCLNMLPLFHSQGINGEFIVPILNGAEVTFADFDPPNLSNVVDLHQPTWFNLVPSMHQAVLSTLRDQTSVFRDTTLRFASSSSAKLTESLRVQLEVTYGIPVVESYGATETGRIATTGLVGSARRPGSVGRTLHAGVKIAAESGAKLSPGEHGEICVTGPSVIAGYENDPVATAGAFNDGWYRTGDEGYFDEDGFLYVTGRIREVVSRGGEKFSLAEIDDAILRLVDLVEGAAFVALDSTLGYEVYAAVVPSAQSNMTPVGVRAALASYLSWAKVPKRVFLVDELPKNAVGKILRDELAETLIEPEICT